MTLKHISQSSFPNYIALSTDIDNEGKISGASIIGNTVYLYDSGTWKIIQDDLTLGNFNIGTTAIQPANNIATLNVGSSKECYVQANEMHFHVHAGTLWASSYFETGIATNATRTFGVQTGSLACHIGRTNVSSGDARIDVYSGATFTTSGSTPLTITNHDLGAIGSPLTTIYYNPTVTVAGTITRTIYVSGGSGGNRVGGVSPFSMEFIIPPNSQLVTKYTNLDGNSSIYNLVIDFYEL